MKPITQIRSTGLTKINQLVRAHRHLAELNPAFAEWSAGEIYICKKSGDYRYRFGDRGKSVATWSTIARRLFATPEAFAFAAMVLGGRVPAEITVAQPAPNASQRSRANIIQMAQEAA